MKDKSLSNCSLNSKISASCRLNVKDMLRKMTQSNSDQTLWTFLWEVNLVYHLVRCSKYGEQIPENPQALQMYQAFLSGVLIENP